MPKLLAKSSIVLISILGVALLGYWAGTYTQRQTTYQLAGLQVARAVEQLQHFSNADNPGLGYSLELSVVVGLRYLPKQDSLMSDLSKSYVTRALNKANCYAELHHWKYISKETIQIATGYIQEKLINAEPCV